MGDNNSWGTPDYAARALDEIKKLRKELLEIELEKAQLLGYDREEDLNRFSAQNFVDRLKRKLEDL